MEDFAGKVAVVTGGASGIGSMLPFPAAIAEATAPNSSGPIRIPITVTADIALAGVGASSTTSNSMCSPRCQTVEEKLTDRGFLPGDPDQHVQGEPAPDHDLSTS